MAQQTKGYCKYCGKEYARGGMLRHLQSCKARKEKLDAESGGKKCGHFELVLSGKEDKITILSRNQPVKCLCSQCRKNEAKWIDQEAYFEENPFWCDECLDREYPDEEDEDLMLLPVCNSPRMGVCGYEGSEKYGDQFVPDTEKTGKSQFPLATGTVAEKKSGGQVSTDGGKQKSCRVLVVVDMQKDFLTGSLGNADCEAAIPSVAKVIAEGGYDEVILTRDTHGEDYLTTQEGRKLPVVHTVKDTEGWQIEKTVMDAVNEHYSKEQITLIDKPGFGSEKLADRIRELGKKYPGDRELVVDFAGVCTDICVISNVFLAKAAAPNAEIRVLEKACAGVTEESHHTAIEAMRGCQVDIV